MALGKAGYPCQGGGWEPNHNPQFTSQIKLDLNHRPKCEAVTSSFRKLHDHEFGKEFNMNDTNHKEKTIKIPQN